MPIVSPLLAKHPIQHLVLVGGGGLCREIVGYVRQEYPRLAISIIDKNPNCEVLEGCRDVTYIGKELTELTRQPDRYVLVSIGNATRRLSLLNELQELGVNQVSYIHPTTYVADTAEIGTGTVICPFSVVNAGANVGECSLINVHCTIGHGAHLGSGSVLSPYCSLSGDAKTGDACFLGTRATLFQKVTIGNHCTVDSHSIVRKSVGDHMIVSNRTKYLAIQNRLPAE